MASVLFCWELGAGFGHLTPHREVLATLARKGHTVHVAVRDLARAGQAFKGLPFRFWQAPTPQSRPERKFAPTVNFTQILFNTGLGAPNGLGARIAAWRSIFLATRPQVTLVDYTPTALLALRGLNIPTVITGTGFFIPPNVSPFPAFSMLANMATPEQLAQQEKGVLQVINRALGQHRIPPLNTLAQLFHEVSGKIFRSLPEFDHYPNRGPAEFLGLPPDPPRPLTAWPAGEGPKVFAYLKPYKFLENLLTEIQQRKLVTIIACDGIPQEMQNKFKCDTMKFVPPTVDIYQMGREASFAITNANLTTSVRLLLQGCPVMTVPLQLEQTLVGANLQDLGVGLMSRNTVVDDLAPHLTEMTQQSKFRDAAKALAEKYKNHPNDYVDRAVEVMERFLPQATAHPTPAT